jgi:HD-GYP domain-containing protein (c-di-GMP phosphodiesterase class II)
MSKINYQEALKNAAKIMVDVKNPEHLLKIITRFLDRQMGVTHASIIIHDPHKKHFVFCDSKGTQKIPVSLIKLDNNNQLIKWFSQKKEKHGSIHKDFLSQHAIDFMLADECLLQSEEGLSKRLHEIKKHMSTLKAHLCIPGYYKGELMGIFLLGNKKDKHDFTKDDISFFQTLASDMSMTIKNAEYHRRLIDKINELSGSLMEIQRLREQDKNKILQTIIAFAHMVDARDPYTFGHSEEVERLGMLTAAEMNIALEADQRQLLSTALLLHDIGKLGVSDAILHKDGPLDDVEWLKMKDHPRIGANILANHEDFKEVSVIIMHHHENYDGSGYPYKLEGEMIPIQSRIIAVVDAFHAMVSDRPYRKGRSYDFAISQLISNSGTQFDPQVVQSFLKIINQELKIVHS